ncbi:Genome sequencing data, contig C304 [Microcystis aeruginosa PCC 9432]|jgi:nitroreductase|uniref:Genome sequencing data, contig C304 n=2 Tax=Microcystis aeruginosa TaxID=1126 RepID=A0A822LGX1_MICAE|nr:MULTISPECIES: NAD(P)H-dependent oxidoreductase [Microcystis]REJ55580.1 MAG: NAD(P)H-dependent oxidoreductase [Microcystis aeruginosa DA14]TRT96911.1 MAG: NAD(P)H-dependent oxidoreductase [Microcystis aeruginosa Ma_OC_LR_19540900_S633]MBE9243226.1 NAD(P)H-dependent oxidoreductase [Microcystis aeruginosa LEGE 00239]MCZ8243119.1 NAD(P)H-dependent oxidoreductase [Microcystis sp. LE19-131.1A]MDB9398172.1 NAD(P)H-dependent oxidoreductase [Microcystis aeruginosa CS-573]
MTIQPQEILEKLQWRYAVKKFDPSKKISEADWFILEESLRLAPSSYGLQPWKFIVVQDPKIRAALTPVSWNQTQVEDCSHYVVLATLTKIEVAYVEKFVAKIAQVRELDVASLENYKNLMVSDLVNGPRSAIVQWWSQRQSYIAMGMLMETAALLDIDACPLEGIEPAAYDRILQLEGSGYAAVAAVALGYRSLEDKYQLLKKVRFDCDDVIVWH